MILFRRLMAVPICAPYKRFRCRMAGFSGSIGKSIRAARWLPLGNRHRPSSGEGAVFCRFGLAMAQVCSSTSTLTFGRFRSTQPHLLPARFDGYPARL